MKQITLKNTSSVYTDYSDNWLLSYQHCKNVTSNATYSPWLLVLSLSTHTQN